jgi:hypothetical protein
MVLGVYWYFGFPDNLYTYDFFTFHKGLGGHADAPAELRANIRVKDADELVHELKVLVDQHAGTFIFVYKSGSDMQVGTGSYSMYDYEFEFALKVEQVFKKQEAKPIADVVLKNAELIRLSNDANPDNTRISKKYFQLVGSSLKKYNAETSSIRFDCNISEDTKSNFLNALNSVTAAVNVHVSYYREKKYEDRYNLMLFFTNGRQGIGMNPKQIVDIAAFEKSMEALISTYDIQIGHIGGFENYPQGNPVVLKIVDEECIL